MKDNKGYYSTLGITDEDKKTLSEEQLSEKIKKNFRKLSIENHPDKFTTASQDEQKKHEEAFKKANEAYSAIGDADKRKQYDASNEGMGGFDFSHFNSSFGSNPFSPFGDNPFGFNFGGGFGGFGNMKGSDIKIMITVTLEEVLNGLDRTFTYNRGVRQVMGNRSVVTLQPTKIPIKLDSGVEEGMILRMEGMGSDSPFSGSQNGDLIIKITIAKHDKFDRDGINLISSTELDLQQAWCGDEVTVETLSGKKLNVKIPPMSQYGRMLRVPNEGLPTLRGVTGDLFIKILYKMPKDINKRQAELLKKFYDIENKK